MTLAEFGAMIADIDPKAKRYFSTERGPCTVWHEYEQIDAYASGSNQGGWKVQVERYTREAKDPVAEALRNAFEQSDSIAFAYLVDSQQEEEGVLIRHLFDCEVW